MRQAALRMGGFQVFDELDPKTRLVLIQYGCHAEAAERFARGEQETYYAQRYTVDFVAELAKRVERVTVISYGTTYPLRRLDNGVYVAGHELHPPKRGGIGHHAALIRLVARERATHAAIACPEVPILAWALTRRMRTIAIFADSFTRKTRKAQLKYKILATILNSSSFEWVSNHNLAASLDLARIGVDRSKIVPFDWPAQVKPSDNEPKTIAAGGPIRLIYVGRVSESKGVGDLIDAVGQLRDQGRDVKLSLVGPINEHFVSEVRQAGLDDVVSFLGRQAHSRVVELMNEHDVVVVPSRHEYPEGLPMTIYEGLCSRSPVVFSDHPMVRLKMRDGQTGLRFEAGSSQSLAQTVARLMDDPKLYARLSSGADEASVGYLCPVKWDRVLAALLSTNCDTRQAIAPYSLASDTYGQLPE